MYVLPAATSFIIATMGAIDWMDSADAYMYSGGPSRGSRFFNSVNRCDPGSSYFDNSPRGQRYRQRRDRIDEAFRELQEEMNDSFKSRRRSSRGRRRKDGRQQRGNVETPNGDFFMMDIPSGAFYKEMDKEAMKKWVDKAFNLASEFNDDFATSDVDREANKEFLEKSKDWVDRLYEAQDEVSSESSPDKTTSATSAASPTKNKDVNDIPGENDEEYEDLDEPSSKMTNDVASKDEQVDKSTEEDQMEPVAVKLETPYSENRSNDEMFQVAVDLPGVERNDIDISFQSDFLTIEAERRPTEEGRPGRKYMKKFVLIEDDVDVDEIDATLKNGILLVSAPKKIKEDIQEEPPRKIQIN